MSGVTALKKINARTKQLKKKHPGKKYSTLRKQAASEYNAGRLPKKRKAAAPKKHRRRKKHTAHRKAAGVGKVKTTRRRATRKRHAPKVITRTRTVTKIKRVGAARKSNTGLILGLGALGLGAVYLMTRKKTVPVNGSNVPLTLTGNTSRDAAAQDLVTWATAASLGVTALTNLINAINNASDSQVTSAATQAQSSGQLPAGWLA